MVSQQFNELCRCVCAYAYDRVCMCLYVCVYSKYAWEKKLIPNSTTNLSRVRAGARSTRFARAIAAPQVCTPIRAKGVCLCII